MGRNAQCRSNFVERSVHRMPVVNKEFMFQRVLTVYGSLPTSVFYQVGVLRDFCSAVSMRYGYCSQAVLSSDEMNFFYIFLCLQ